MKTIMKRGDLTTVDQLAEFLSGTSAPEVAEQELTAPLCQ